MQVSEAEAVKAYGRVLADLIAFGVQDGIGYYADRNYHLCMPFIFDGYLADILDNAPNLRSEDFAAIG